MKAEEKQFLEEARVARLGMLEPGGTPRVLPICFALVEERIVSAVDEKPKSVPAEQLARVRYLRKNPSVCLLVDRYTEDWDGLGWVQVRGLASIDRPGSNWHSRSVRALQEKYQQYRNHKLGNQLLLTIRATEVVSWGQLGTL